MLTKEDYINASIAEKQRFIIKWQEEILRLHALIAKYKKQIKELKKQAGVENGINKKTKH